MGYYYFISAVVFFLLVYVFSGLWKIRRATAIFQNKENENIKFLYSNFIFIVLNLIALLCVAIIVFYNPNGINFYSFSFMEIEILKYVGLFFAKFSCLWLVISTFEISKIFSSAKSEVNINKIYKTEVIISSGVSILSLGSFLFLPNPVTLALLLVSIYLPLKIARSRH